MPLGGAARAGHVTAKKTQNVTHLGYILEMKSSHAALARGGQVKVQHVLGFMPF